MSEPSVPAVKTILIVDDDPQFCEWLKEILEMNGYRVVMAHDGLEAVERTQQIQVSLILMDIRMPLFSGFWFCEAFHRRKNTANVPVVIVSGFLDEPSNVERAYRSGACATVLKPFKNDEILRVVSTHAC